MRKRVFLIFVLAYLLTLLVTAPASLLGKFAQYASKGHLLLGNASGTIWNGSATPALRKQDGHLLLMPPLNWKIMMPSLFTGKIAVRLNWDSPSPASATIVTLSFGQIELDHVSLTLPARVLEDISATLKPAMLDGHLTLQSNQLVFSRQGMIGNAGIDWNEASSGLSNINPLGNYHFALNGNNNVVDMTLTTTSGILQLEGSGKWREKGKLEFHGKAYASPENQDSLSELLHSFGPEISPGVHQFNLIQY